MRAVTGYSVDHTRNMDAGNNSYHYNNKNKYQIKGLEHLENVRKPNPGDAVSINTEQWLEDSNNVSGKDCLKSSFNRLKSNVV
jgi:hypothetical protein